MIVYCSAPSDWHKEPNNAVWFVCPDFKMAQLCKNSSYKNYSTVREVPTQFKYL